MPVCSTAVLQWVYVVIVVITAHLLHKTFPLVDVSGVTTALLEALQRQPWQSHVHFMTFLVTDGIFYLSKVYMFQNSGICFSSGTQMKWTYIMWGNLSALLMLFIWQNSDELWCSQGLEPHLQLWLGAQRWRASDRWRFALKRNFSPTCPEKISTLLLQLTKVTFSKDLPSKCFHSFSTSAALTILATASIRSFLGPCSGAFPVW